MSTITETLELEVSELRQSIDTMKADQAAAKSLADELVASYKEKGVNPLTDEDAFAEVDAAVKQESELAARIGAAKARLASVVNDWGHPVAQNIADQGGGHVTASGSPSVPMSPAARFIASGVYAELAAKGMLDGNSRLGDTGKVEVASRDEVMGAWLAADPIDGSPLVPSDRRLSNPIPLPERQVRVLDLITVGSTDSDSVEYAYQSLNTQNAAPTVDTGAGTAPKSDYEWLTATATVRWIPHWVTAVKSQLADQAQLKTLLDGGLVNGCRLAVESQVLAGDGTGVNFTGIVNAAGITTAAKLTDTVPDALHKAITRVRISLEDDITAIGVHPNDYERFSLEKDSAGMYVNNQGPQMATPRMIWGYPAIVSTVFTEGTAVVGNYRRGATLWNRSGIMVSATDQHADYFVKNLVAVKAETRAAFAVTQPKAFSTVTGLNA